MLHLLNRFTFLSLILGLLILGRTSSNDTERAEAAGIALDQLATGLSQPLGIVNAGDGSDRLFIVEKGGLIRIWDGNALLGTPFLDVSGIITDPAGAEQGLLGLVFHPNYEANGFFYITYTNVSGSVVVRRYTVSANPDVANAASGATILTQAHPGETNHNSGQLQFGPDGYLYIGLGDGGGAGDPNNNAQNNNTLLGKLVRIDVDGGSPYAIPADNPLVGVAGLDEIWANGLRNAWRFSFDRLTGDLFIADVGQNALEEVNFQAAGVTSLRNYGWRVMEGTACYNPSSGCDTSGKTLPIIEYGHSLGCSVTGGYRYRGGDATLYGKYIYGDFCSGRIWTAAESGGTWSSTQVLDTSETIATFGEDESGELYLAGFGSGRLYKITDGADTDGDGVQDTVDNCVSTPNPGQENADANFIDLSPPKAYDDRTLVNSDEAGDACDTDDDNDGLTDAQETSGSACGGSVTLPTNADSDGDLFVDGAECQFGDDPNSIASMPELTDCGAAIDEDGDGLTTRTEICFYASNPVLANTDGDVCGDGMEAASINADTRVNSIDLSQVAQSFGMYPLPAAAVTRTFDINKDFKVSSIDLAQVAQKFGPC